MGDRFIQEVCDIILQVKSKSTYLHYVSEVGKCHWCKSEIEVTEFTDCPKCKSLNIYPFASDTIS